MNVTGCCWGSELPTFRNTAVFLCLLASIPWRWRHYKTTKLRKIWSPATRRSISEEYEHQQHLLTYSLNPWSSVLLEKVTLPHLVNKFPAFYGTWRSITAFTSARHLSLSLPTSQFLQIHLKYYPPIYAWVSQAVSFPQVSPPKSCVRLSSPPYVLHDPLV